MTTRNDNSGTFHDILKMMQQVMHYLLRKEPDLKERLGDIMGGKVLPSDKLREARAAGLEQGIAALVNTCNALKIAKETTAERLILEFALSEK